MIKRRNAIIAIVMLIMIFSASHIQTIARSGNTDTESRSIYVGDIIEIRIITQEFSRDELEEKFKDFEIVSIEEEKDGYIIALRTFETGEKRILLGDKEIVIDVKSTLDEIQRDDVFEGSLDPEEVGFSIEWRYVFYFLLAVMIVSGCISFKEYLGKRKVRTMTPFERFILQINNVSSDDDMFFVKLTASFKEYIESAYLCCIRGKTSSELVEAISGFPALHENLTAIKAWLTECDRLKFSGIKVSKEKRQDFCSELIELVKKIDEKRIEDLKLKEAKKAEKAKGVAS